MSQLDATSTPHSTRESNAWATWGEALEGGAALLAIAGSPSPALDALTLLMRTLGVPHGVVESAIERPLAPHHAQSYAAWLGRRAEGEPVAQIIGHKAFMGLDLRVDRRVLLVRPSSQALVEVALEFARLRPGDDPLSAADVGTGSGAVALALATLEPRFARIYGTDYSADALAVARENGARYDMRERIIWAEGDLLAPVPERVDIIVANLPYVPGDGPPAAPSVARFEPAIALYGGPDGLDLLRRMIAQAPAKLRPYGALALLALEKQRHAIVALIEAALPAALVHHIALGQGECALVAYLEA